MKKLEFPKIKDVRENIKAYQETCNTIRHYSNSSYNVRVLVIVQGLVLIGAWILHYNKVSSSILALISILGLLLTGLLCLFHYGYFSATSFFYELASRMEDKLFDEGFKPFKEYNELHSIRYKSFFKKVGILYAPFTLTAIFFIVTLIFSLSKN